MKLANRAQTRASNRKRSGRQRGLRFETLELRRLLAADINGTFYEDVDSNGVKSPQDNTLSGWVAFVDIDQNGVLNNLPDGSPEPSAIANAGGDYTINMAGRPSGVYRVAEVLEAGWVPTVPASLDVTFNAGQSTNRIDFFNFAGGTIEGTVWNDLNKNTIRDFADPGLVGWTVFLDINNSGSVDATEPSTVTDAEGFYQFTDVPAGDYEVTEIQPAGWDTNTDIKQTATVKALQTVTQDFENFSAVNGSITGTVWNDQNGNGDRSVDPLTGLPTEPGLEGWTVFLDDNGNGTLDATESLTTTDASGNYVFPSVPWGNHRVREILPTTKWSAAPGFSVQQIVNVRINENTSGVDFANFTVLNGAISGSVWNDVNRDGVRNSLLGTFVEPGLQGWTIFLDMNHSGAFDTGEPTVASGADGTYLFSDLQIGDYDLIEVVPSGWETAPGFGDNQTVRVYSGATSTAPDFANFNLSTLVLGTVSGSVWDDVNGNGLRETTPTAEPGTAGWTVFADLNGDRVADLAEPKAVTAADGSFSISGVTPGSVTIVVQSRNGWHATSPITGTRSLALKNGENATNVNFGEQQARNSSLSGSVFVDANKNGVRDAGENGLSGIVVYLDINGNAVRDADEPSITTSEDQFYTPSVNEAGSYSFTHLGDGTYSVRQEVSEFLSATPASEMQHSVTILASLNVSGVDFADVYRRNEIHGVKFNDLDGDGIRDPGEAGIAGATVFIDMNRNDGLDLGEPTTVTLASGSYEFLDLSPGAYVVREMLESGHTRTSPSTTGGILWPMGVSNLAVGNVTPLSITQSLADGEHFSQNVTITLPGSGGLTNLVDVFLLFDDTGSFTNNSPIVRGAFPTIMADLQSSLPGVDLGFGVGRFEEYANFASEYSTGRPFVLNQPIVASGTTGYQAAIQAALNRTAPGYGGDGPETDIEALYQLVTGLGFDGNNNGSVMDSGVAGLGSTQLTPGASGDVPSFASYTVDTASGALASAGTIGGGGFRAGALPVILLATDIGFAYQPKGETSITGVGGASLPINAFTQTSRGSTPNSLGAGIQETITGLNALGALVIGLGTNPGATLDPRQGLESIARLTGATNQSAVTIANGTSDPIAPGDPFYFQIASGFASSVSAGVTSAIQNAVTNVAVNISVQASDPRVHIINHTGTQGHITSGQTAAFDIEFIGDGVPHRFDLQFVREGTNVVLGSIPVVLGTPVPGDGYHFDELNDGEIELEDHFGDATGGNHAPVAVNDSYSVDQDSTLTIAAAGVLGNDTDADGNAFTATQLVAPSHGTLSLAANGSFTYTPTTGFIGTDSFTYVANDGSLDSNIATVIVTVNSTTTPGGTKFFVVDESNRRTFEYDANGFALENDRLNEEDESPRGIAARPDGSTLWVVDDKGEVFIYDNDHMMLGSWEVKSVDKPEGVTIHGNDLWIVDRSQDRVYFFQNGALLRTGEASPTSSFGLNRANRNPLDLVTDGTHIWVVNDTSTVDRVFRYTVGGSLDGSWQIDANNAKPTGLTIDPNDVDHIWIVDSGSDSVYQYDSATSRVSGQQSAGDSFALDPSNRNAQGIADPRPALRVAKKSTDKEGQVASELVGRVEHSRLASPTTTPDTSSVHRHNMDPIQEFLKIAPWSSHGAKAMASSEVRYELDQRRYEQSHWEAENDRAISELDLSEELYSTLASDIENLLKHTR